MTVPEPGHHLSGLEVRVYRNSKQLIAQPVTDVGRIKVRDVPLRRGSNHLTATLGNNGGEGPRSDMVTITVDDQAPKVTVKSPKSGSALNQRRITIVGKTEAGLTVTARNATSGSTATMTVGSSGAFGLDVRLAPGRNTITVRARDVAGNLGGTSLAIVRGDGHAAVDLRLSRKKLPLRSLPRTLNARVTVRDADGRPVDGAVVTFTMSPPGQLTSTYTTTTKSDGTASWSGIRIIRPGTTRGFGLVTARADLPHGGGNPERSVKFEIR